ncbi:MAG: ABC transporter permease [Aquisalinus sp.]|nr:ABC transporter permease [Aquisalinus sp.]
MRFPLFSLSYKSLLNRRVSVFLTVLSLALSVTLFAGVEKIREGVRSGFETTISGTDLIIGARTGQINLLLYTIFRIGEGTPGISWESYQIVANRPDVAWTIPLSLGDSHRGYRVVGTDNNYFEHYKYGQQTNLAFAEGGEFENAKDVVIGAKVAADLAYSRGDRIRIAHGLVATEFAEHDAEFVITGILRPTGTPVDASVHVTLEGLDLVHEDEPQSTARPAPAQAKASEAEGHDHGDEAHDHEGHDHAEDESHADHTDHDHVHTPGQISAFLVGMTSRPLALRLQGQVNNYQGEALMAILPGVTLQQLWSMFGVAETALFAISAFVIAVGLIGMLIRILASLNERRREMAILRALGARPGHIFSLLVCETMLSAFIGALLGLGILYGGFALAGQVFADSASIPAFDAIISQKPGLFDLWLVGGVTFLAALMSLFPAWKAFRDSLSDGLTIRV